MMPRFDGTGPSGAGPTGRGRGGCRGFGGSLRTRRGRMFGSMFFTACGLVVNDARNPDSLTRRTVRSLGNSLRKLRAKRRSAQRAVMPPDDNARLAEQNGQRK